MSGTLLFIFVLPLLSIGSEVGTCAADPEGCRPRPVQSGSLLQFDTARQGGRALARNSSQAAEVQLHESEAVSETTVTELAYLSGGVGQHTVTLTDTLGWEVGTAMVDRTYQAMGFLDTAQVYKKGKMCAIVFSATDDPIDSQQQMMGMINPVDFCGITGVNAGYAQEMKAYMHTPEWQMGIEELKACDEVYAAGHSMGGSMASLFAYCANTDEAFEYKSAFGSLPEVSLVTFGAAPPGMTPLYNGKPGVCFRGTRRFVSAVPKTPSKGFHVRNLEFFGHLAQHVGGMEAPAEYAQLSAMAKALAAKLAEAAQGLKSVPYPSAQSDSILGQALPAIGPMWIVVFATMLDWTLPGYEMLAPVYPNIRERTNMFLELSLADLLYSYDPVPQIFSVFGFKHPLVKADPQAHSGGKGEPRSGTECGDAAGVPNEDYAQLFWGFIMNLGGAVSLQFANHGMCCLISDADCKEKFTGTGAGIDCHPSEFR